MLTNNFKQWMKTICSGKTENYSQEGMPVIRDVNGNRYELLGICHGGYNGAYNVSPFCFAQASPMLRLDSSIGVIFGCGANPFSRDDYKIEMIVKGIEFTPQNFIGVKEDSGHPYVEKVIVCTNNSDNSVTITEVGFYCTLFVREGADRYQLKKFLMDRTLLSSPVTIGKYESCTINYSIVNQFDV